MAEARPKCILNLRTNGEMVSAVTSASDTLLLPASRQRGEITQRRPRLGHTQTLLAQADGLRPRPSRTEAKKRTPAAESDRKYIDEPPSKRRCVDR